MPSEQNIEVAIKYDPSSKTWQMQDPAGSGNWKGAPDYYTLNVPAKNTGKITFTIQGGNAQFEPNQAAISDVAIAAGKGKPLTGSHSGQLHDFKTSNQNSVLKLKDKNSFPQPFDINYVLHFAGDVPDLDPIIKNGGDPPLTQRSALPDVAFLLIGAVVLALVAYMLGRRNAKG